MLIDKEKQVLELNGLVEMLTAKVLNLTTHIKDLKNDSIQNGAALNMLHEKHQKLNDTYDLLTSKNSRLMADKAKETKKLLEQLEQAKSELFIKTGSLIGDALIWVPPPERPKSKS